MTLREVPAPTVEAGSLLIRVHAAGLNPLDYKIRQGKVRLINRLDLPRVAGSELAGVVHAVGPGSPASRKGTGCSLESAEGGTGGVPTGRGCRLVADAVLETQDADNEQKTTRETPVVARNTGPSAAVARVSMERTSR